MYILTLRTDKPEAEIGLYRGNEQVSYQTWPAHRQLAETIHLKIEEVLSAYQLSLSDLAGIAIYQGPGSFTGLRIGLSVANALAAAHNLAIIGASGESWLEVALKELDQGADDRLVLPDYGALPNITAPKK